MSELPGFSDLVMAVQIRDFTEAEWSALEHIAESHTRQVSRRNDPKSPGAEPLTTADYDDLIGSIPALERIGKALDEVAELYLSTQHPGAPVLGYGLKRTGSWMSVYKTGQARETHTHDSDVSVVLFVDDVPEEDGGVLGFLNPTNRHVIGGTGLLQTTFRKQFTLTPQRCVAVAFPGYLEHFATEYQGLDTRRIIAADFAAFDSK
ncbi:hypothetical protein TW86_04030 [Halomonas sp. S2151]|uniref:putative 2OG-Fe(II) oxygenase n=1 Tax=Halomonas sp. S2151 TaxID=579478 RepID=UPI0005FA3BD4|nr:putative 2OG-Fe(II) oxygenase [Halomonas sp. S2151]KJZ17429.1 hypothetical protein TW86_04030 [Halomonas sp. S2151]